MSKNSLLGFTFANQVKSLLSKYRECFTLDTINLQYCNMSLSSQDKLTKALKRYCASAPHAKLARELRMHQEGMPPSQDRSLSPYGGNQSAIDFNGRQIDLSSHLLQATHESKQMFASAVSDQI